MAPPLKEQLTEWRRAFEAARNFEPEDDALYGWTKPINPKTPAANAIAPKKPAPNPISRHLSQAIKPPQKQDDGQDMKWSFQAIPPSTRSTAQTPIETGTDAEGMSSVVMAENYWSDGWYDVSDGVGGVMSMRQYEARLVRRDAVQEALQR